jgi:hypothetical protein
MFVVLPRKVDSMLPGAGVEPNRGCPLSRGKGISLCCSLSVETVTCLRNSVYQQTRAAAALSPYPALGRYNGVI